MTEAGIASTMDELKRSGAFRQFKVSAPASLDSAMPEPVQSDGTPDSSSAEEDTGTAVEAEHLHFPEKRIKRDRQRISNMGMPDPVTGTVLSVNSLCVRTGFIAFYV